MCPGCALLPRACLASSSRTQVPGQTARAIACFTSGVVSIVVHQRPWLIVVEVTQLDTQPHRLVASQTGLAVYRRSRFTASDRRKAMALSGSHEGGPAIMQA